MKLANATKIFRKPGEEKEKLRIFLSFSLDKRNGM